jgi:uncharacterized protein YbbC (DUF1343 family)
MVSKEKKLRIYLHKFIDQHVEPSNFVEQPANQRFGNGMTRSGMILLERGGTMRSRNIWFGISVIMASVLMISGCAMLQRPLRAVKVESGVDSLREENFKRMKGHKVGLICNHSALSSTKKHLFDLMRKSDNVELVALFAPEHGFRGVAERQIQHGKEEKTGIPIYSLYGETLRPTPEMLKGIDLLVFDIQDIGTRFYTYIATLAMCMEEAARHNIKFMVLDRPNPIGGLYVDGPIQDPDLFGGFTAYFPMPVVHGMTVGELALMFNDFYGIQCDLEVVKMKGWKRSMYFDETGLPWVNPSPNIRNVTEELLYPGFAMTEGANVSVGRGTPTPFEVYGAPWINAEELTREMQSRQIPGLAFEAISFTPDASTYQGQQCNGFHVTITDREALKVVPAGIHFIDALYKLYPKDYEIDKIRPLVGQQAIIDMIKARKSVDDIVLSWQDDLKRFIKTRQQFLIYKE